MTVQEILEGYAKKLFTKLDKYLISPVSIKNMYIAGGCIRSVIEQESPKDIDIFFKKDVNVDEVKKFFKLYHPESFITENAISLNIDGIQYQLITTCTGNPLDIINEFDFTMNMNFYDFETKHLFIQDKMAIFNKHLKINLKCRNKLGTLARIVKFTERGYKIPTQLNLIELGVQLTRQKPVDSFPELQDSSKLFFSRSNYDSLSVVSTSESYDKVFRNYKGSAV